MLSTTATVMCSRWCCRLLLGCARVEDGCDAVPEAAGDPGSVPRVDRLPRPASWRCLAPRHAGVHHRQHALQLAPQIPTGPAPRWRWWRQQRGDLLPVRRAQLGRARHAQHRDRSGCRGAGLRRRRTLRPAGAMAPAGHRLVLAAPLRPMQVVRALGALWCRQEQQQAPYLGHRQRDQFCPFGRRPPPPRGWSSGPAARVAGGS